MGARDAAAATRSTYSGLKLGWGYSLIMGVFFVFLPGVLTDIFRPDMAEASAEAIAIFDAARPMSIFMLRIATFYIFVEVLLVVYAGALRGAGDTVWVMFTCAIMNWCVSGALYVAAYIFHLPAHYAWIAVVAVYSTAPVIFWWRWKSGKWRKHVMDKDIYVPIYETEKHFHGMEYKLPYERSLKQQMITGTLSERIGVCKYKSEIERIAKAVMADGENG